MKSKILVDILKEFAGMNPAVFVRTESGEFAEVVGADWTGKHRNGIEIKYEKKEPDLKTAVKKVKKK